MDQALRSIKGVCCTPFKDSGITTRNVGGLKIAAQTVDVAELTVLVDSWCSDNHGNPFRASAGDKVYVPGNLYATTWAKEQWTLSGSEEKFIMVPTDQILFVKPVLHMRTDVGDV